ncbi:MAG: ferrous iron transport protein A [Elusimicrobia bacterium]|nr:ferrous iron transport protein A [Elusimicrobiota bacterium]
MEKSKKTVSVAEMGKGSTGRVIRLDGGQGFTGKMDCMGIIPGAVITKVNQPFFKGPVVVKCRNAQVAIGNGMARKIIVEVLKD